MKRFTALLFSLCLVSVGEARAMAVDEFSPNLLMAKQPSVEPYFKAEIGLGLLDDAGITGGKGTAMITRFGVGFEPTENVEAAIVFPMAGTLSSGPDDFGIGNITLELKYLQEAGNITWGLGADFALPTASSGAAIGTFTRRFTHFVDNQFAASPYGLLSYAKDRIMVTFDLGVDLQVFTTTPAGLDSVESLVGYDTAVGYAVLKNYWLTIEFGGHTPLSFDEDSQFFGGAGFRYQDYQFSAGGMIMAPFASPDRDQLDLIFVMDLRLLF